MAPSPATPLRIILFAGKIRSYKEAMPSILYTVRSTCKDLHQRGRFLAWLVPGHVLGVKAGGGGAVRVSLPDRESDTAPVIVEAQYVVPSRTAFDTSMRDHMPALRADLLKQFPPESGITYARQVAEIAAEL